MSDNGFLIIGGVVVIGTSLINAYTHGQGLTKPGLGAIVAVILLALLALFGTGPAKLAKAFMLLLIISVLYLEGPPILKKAGF